MNLEKRLEKIEGALLPPAKLTVEIVDEGDDIVMIGVSGQVIRRVSLEEDGEE